MNERVLSLILVATMSFSLAAGEHRNAQALLAQDTWHFSASELASLNQAQSNETAPLIYAAIRAAGRGLSPIKISESQWICMTPDGPAQLAVRIVENPRGMARGLYVVSKVAGKYLVSTVEDAAPIRFYRVKGRALLVAYQEILLLTEADPKESYPLLYAWEGNGLKEVSGDYPEFYQKEFIPVVHACIEENFGMRGANEAKPAKSTMEASSLYEDWPTLKLAGMALAIAKVNSMFSRPIVGKREANVMAIMLKDRMPKESQVHVDERRASIRRICEKALKAIQYDATSQPEQHESKSAEKGFPISR
jgi:hypothetical protein